MRCLVVEDEPHWQTTIAQIIAGHDTLELIGICPNLSDALATIRATPYEMLVVDLGLPDGSGIELIRETAARHPATDIMVISVFGDEEHVLASIEAGATGYILKDSLPEEFVGLIAELRAGGSPISPVIARKLLKRFQPKKEAVDPTPEPATSGLTPRESEVLALIAKGFSFGEIARLLEVSPHTITAHVKKIYQKLAVHSRGEAVYEAGKMGLL